MRDQERLAAGLLKGRKTRGSGSGSDKGDAVNALFRIECKTTGKDSLRFRRIG